MPYVDGFVTPVPKKNIQEYRRIALKCGKIWVEHGALEFRECVGDDLNSKWTVPIPKRLKLKRTDTVLFSWITFKSRAHRDRVNARVMKDPRMDSMMKPGAMPFDPTLMMYGGFKVIVDL